MSLRRTSRCGAHKLGGKSGAGKNGFRLLYTVADSWTFLRANITDIESELPVIIIESSREYVEKIEAETILKTLKYMVSLYIPE